MRIYSALSISLLFVGQQAAAQTALPPVSSQSVNVISPPSAPAPRIINSPKQHYGFGGGYTCPTPTLSVNAFSSNGHGTNSFGDSNSNHTGGSISLTIPLGGSLAQSCEEIAETVSRERGVAQEAALVAVCADLIANNVTVDPAAFPHLAVCSAVAIK